MGNGEESRLVADRSAGAYCAVRQTCSADVSSCSVCQRSVMVAARQWASRSRAADIQPAIRQTSRTARIARTRLPPEGKLTVCFCSRRVKRLKTRLRSTRRKLQAHSKCRRIAPSHLRRGQHEMFATAPEDPIIFITGITFALRRVRRGGVDAV